MEFTDKERLFLINQYEILQRLDPDNADSYAEKIEILQNGYAIFYSEVGKFVFDEMSEEEGREVLDILSMYTDLERSYDALNKPASVSEHFVRFPGFDGNNECPQLGFTRFLIETQGKFQDLKGGKNDHYNSRAPLLPKFRAMLKTWNGMRTDKQGIPHGQLTEAQLNEILKSEPAPGEVMRHINRR